MIFYIIGIGLAIFALVEAAIIYNLLRKLESTEDYTEQVIDVLARTRDSVIHAVSSMREVDDQQMFELDDEVGLTFKQLLGIVEDLDADVARLVGELSDEWQNEREEIMP